MGPAPTAARDAEHAGELGHVVGPALAFPALAIQLDQLAPDSINRIKAQPCAARRIGKALDISGLQEFGSGQNGALLRRLSHDKMHYIDAVINTRISIINRYLSIERPSAQVLAVALSCKEGRCSELILLCHKLSFCALGGTALACTCWQHGQRGRRRAKSTVRRRRIEMIDNGLWRSGRIGMPSRPPVRG